MPRGQRTRLLSALTSLSPLITGLSAYPTPASLSKLPWAKARPLVAAVAAQYKQQADEGTLYLLLLLCMPRLRRLRLGDLDISPADLSLWLADGAKAGLSDPLKRVKDRIANGWRDEAAYQEALTDVAEGVTEASPSCPDPILQLDALGIWRQLSPEDQETIRASEETDSVEECAKVLGLSLDGAKSRLRRLRERLQTFFKNL